MNWVVVQCSRLECSKYMVARFGTKKKKCPYCNKNFSVDDAFINNFVEQESARLTVRKLNIKL